MSFRDILMILDTREVTHRVLQELFALLVGWALSANPLGQFRTCLLPDVPC